MTLPSPVPDPPLQLNDESSQREELVAEIRRLKEEKARAVEEEDYEEAAVLKRRIKVLEDTLGQSVQYESRKVDPSAVAAVSEETVSPKSTVKPLSQKEHGEDLWQMPPKEMKLVEDERIFIERSKLAMRQKGVTDDTVQGVPAWAYKDVSMAEFNFLSSAWGIELTDASKQEISDQANSLGRKDVEEYIKDSDLRKLKHASLLPKEMARMSAGTVPVGQYLVQLQKVADITQPT
eukprot:symbB.v1.2.029563.t1/scaffold3247.1/size61943/1